MRLAHLRTATGLRLAVRSGGVWTDLAQETGDERLSVLSGLLAAGEDGLALARNVGKPAGKAGMPRDDGAVPDLGPVLDRPGKIVCVGRNYVAHASEMGKDAQAWPEIFLRVAGTVAGPSDNVRRPSLTSCFDYEGELGVVIGRGGRHIKAADALESVFGYCVVNDVTARDWQHRGQQWTPGKNFDGTLPVGPEIVTCDEIDWRNLTLETRVNGEIVQLARTSQMIFDIPSQIEFISSWTTLDPGDLIATGTPGGVGVARNPPLLLGDGDVVEVRVESVGTIRNRIVDDDSRPSTLRWRELARGEEGSHARP